MNKPSKWPIESGGMAEGFVALGMSLNAKEKLSNTDGQKGIYENRAIALKFIQFINLIRSAK